MPWREVVVADQRGEFVRMAQVEGTNISELCRRFGVSRPVGYKWLQRGASEGRAGLEDRSRRPLHSPTRTPAAVEERVVALRDEHPVWGARKLRRRLEDLGEVALPSATTITAILRRHGRLRPGESAQHRPYERFEHPQPNALWQMDFKGHFRLVEGRCHALTVLDDHSRYALGLVACGDEQGRTVQEALTGVFRQYGLPARMLMDNGAPWGSDLEHPHTPLTSWLIRLGVGVSHGRPYHPQTQGKVERFHRTLEAELLRGRQFRDLAECAEALERWRHHYNLERPHEALGLVTPVQRYHVSAWAFPESLPPIEYEPGDLVRKVQQDAAISVKGRPYRVGKAFIGQPVAVRATTLDGIFEVYFCHQRIKTIDLRVKT